MNDIHSHSLSLKERTLLGVVWEAVRDIGLDTFCRRIGKEKAKSQIIDALNANGKNFSIGWLYALQDSKYYQDVIKLLVPEKATLTKHEEMEVYHQAENEHEVFQSLCEGIRARKIEEKTNQYLLNLHE